MPIGLFSDLRSNKKRYNDNVIENVKESLLVVKRLKRTSTDIVEGKRFESLFPKINCAYPHTFDPVGQIHASLSESNSFP